MPSTTAQQRRETFRTLHASGCFLIPNPFDLGSARLLQAAGHPALATTSSGFAATQGRGDHQVTRDELVTHVRALSNGVDVPVSVDAESCFFWEDGGAARTAELLADAGAAGLSVEDVDSRDGSRVPMDEAARRVTEVADAAHRHGLTVTARCESFLHGSTDLADLLNRLAAYRDAGADVLFAPGVVDPAQLRQVVALGLPVNVLKLPGSPSVPELADLGVRRVSTGGALTWTAYAALLSAVAELDQEGTASYLQRGLTAQQRSALTGR